MGELKKQKTKKQVDVLPDEQEKSKIKQTTVPHCEHETNDLGSSDTKGECSRKDYIKAVEWFKKAAIKGVEKGQEQLRGLQNREKEDATKKETEQGTTEEANNLGSGYNQGKRVAKDCIKAVEWFKKAAIKGVEKGQEQLRGLQHRNKASTVKTEVKQMSAEAQFNIGWRYFEGKGVTRDYLKAVEWYKKAAKQGYAYAQYALGYCYEKGIGVTQDDTEAVEWYEKAVAQGVLGAKEQIKGLLNKQKESTVKTETEQMSAEAQFNIGWRYFEGKGVTRDYIKAVEWYKKAAKRGHAYAQYALGYCYEKGIGVTQDDTEAVEWYEKAVAQGVLGAKEQLKGLQHK